MSLPQIGLYLMPHLSAFQQMFPQVALELDFADRLVNVIEEGFDAVLRIGEIDDSRLSMRKLNSYQHLLVAAPSYLARYGAPLRPADLSSHVCLRYRFPSSGKLLPWPLLERGQQVSVEVPESVIANDTGTLHAMAEAGVGIAVLPEFVVADAVATGRLTKCSEAMCRISATFTCYGHRGASCCSRSGYSLISCWSGWATRFDESWPGLRSAQRGSCHDGVRSASTRKFTSRRTLSGSCLRVG